MIKKIYIENFRSIKELTLNPQNLCALVGPNSTGKTNVLKAIDLVLGEGWTTKAKVARELFYDESKKINIHIDLSTEVPYMSFRGAILINKVTLTMKLHPELECEVRLWSNYPNDNQGKGFFINDEFKKACHFIYIPSNRDLSDQMRVSSWTLLGKMMKVIHENYIEHYEGDQEKLKFEFSKLMEEPKKFLENDFVEDKITFKKFSDTFIKYCLINSAGLANTFNPKLNIYNLNWFYKTLQIAVSEDFANKTFDSEEVGAGMQNLILISIFQTYAELMKGKVIMAIEEPELYLYPQAQRELYKSFQELSQSSQIFYTTHNQNFVNARRAYDVEMLFKNNEKGTYSLEKNKFISKEEAEKQKYKIYTHFNTERNEIFFAKKILLVEGDSDKIMWTTLCEEKWNINIDKEGISIIECGGKNGVIYFIGFCKLMGIENYFAVWDEDDEAGNETIDQYNSLSDCIKKGLGLEIKGNLEKFLRSKYPIEKYPQFIFSETKKLENAHYWAINSPNVPSEFNIVCDFLKPAEIKELPIIEVLESKLLESDDIPF